MVECRSSQSRTSAADQPRSKARRSEGGAEPVDTTNAPGLLISQHPQLGGNRVLERPCGDGCEIGLNDEVRHRSRKQLTQFIWHWLTRQQGNSGERRHSAECRQPQPRRLPPGPLHQLLAGQRSVAQPGAMPGSGIGELIRVQHCAWRYVCDQPQNCHPQSCSGGGVRLLAESVAAGFGGSGEETVCSEPCFGNQPPAGRGVGAEPLVIVRC